jgi:hypothetical protein
MFKNGFYSTVIIIFIECKFIYVHILWVHAFAT